MGLPFPGRAGADDEATETPVEFDRPPRVLEMLKPEYPQLARQESRGGLVVLKVGIDETGHVTDASVLEAAHEDLGAAAVAAVRDWRFEPAKRKDGTPTPCVITIPLEFNLDGTSTDPRPPITQILQGALDIAEMKPHWHVEDLPGRTPLVVLVNRQLRQFGRPSQLELTMFGEPVQLRVPSLLDDAPHVEFTRISIGDEDATVEFEYAVEKIHGKVELVREGGRWIVKKSKVKSGK